MELLRKNKCVIFLSALAMSLLCSCSMMLHTKPRKDAIKNLSDIKWTGNGIGAERKMRMDGFYIDSCSNYCLIFFADGTCAECYIKGLNLEQMQKDLAACVYWTGYKRGRWGYNVGVYEVEDSLIYANYYYSDFFMFCNLWRDMTKVVYRVEDANTITLIDKCDYDILSNKAYKRDTVVKYQFYHSDVMPFSHNKMKKKKWMWSDQEAWRKYRQEYRHRNSRKK